MDTLATVLWRADARNALAPASFRDLVRLWNEAHGKGGKSAATPDPFGNLAEDA